MQPWTYELIGYVASALVAVSLMMSSVLRLRGINLLGSAAFTVYGMLIQAYPVAAVNFFIVLINLFYLRRMLATREFFDLLEVEPDSRYLRHFLGFYRTEIRHALPDFALRRTDDQLGFFILRDLVPAGLFIGEVHPDGCLRVHLDFVIPSYRDFKVGRYLFRERADFFRARGISQIVSEPGTREHERYLRRMGFAPADPADPAAPYRLQLG
jgi:GNAT superfamily N-acetyltransferase